MCVHVCSYLQGYQKFINIMCVYMYIISAPQHPFIIVPPSLWEPYFLYGHKLLLGFRLLIFLQRITLILYGIPVVLKSTSQHS